METPAIKKKCSQAQIEASKRYYEKNKARISSQVAEKGMERYYSDDNYREDRIAYMKAYYRSKKEQLEQAKELLAKNNIPWMPVADKSAYGVPH
jgi:hypothetical protein